MTSRVSAISALPSGESFSEGLDRALEARKLLRATSIWSFCRGDHVSVMQLCRVQNKVGGQGSAQRRRVGQEMPAVTYRGNLASLESGDDAVELKLAVDIGLLLLEVGRFVNVC